MNELETAMEKVSNLIKSGECLKECLLLITKYDPNGLSAGDIVYISKFLTEWDEAVHEVMCDMIREATE